MQFIICLPFVPILIAGRLAPLYVLLLVESFSYEQHYGTTLRNNNLKIKTIGFNMAEATTAEKVLVTGATGFVAAHIIKLLQEKGYPVRGTVRGLDNEDKVSYLKELVPEAAHPIELVEADCTKEDGWESAVEGCTFVIHTASPLPIRTPADENEVIAPAVEGVKNVLKAAKEAKCVKRVVLTSAGLAVMGYMREGEFSEKDWPENEDELDAYAKSKTKAEKEAWEFVKNLEEGEKFELAVINPTAVLGPVLNKQPGTAAEIMKRILTKNPPMLPKLNFPVVDVRDVAQAHYMAMTVPEAAGNRHLVSTDNIWWSEIAAHITEEFKPQGYKIATMGCPKVGIQLAAIFDKDVKAILSNWNVVTKVDTTRMKEVLKIKEPIDLKTTMIDMAYSLIEGGFVKKTSKYRGRDWREVFEKEKAEREQVKEERIAAKRASKSAKKSVKTNGDAGAGDAPNGDAAAVKENGDGEEEKKDEGTEKGGEGDAPATEEKKEEETSKSEDKVEEKTEGAEAEAAKEDETKEAETKEDEKTEEKQEAEETKEEAKEEAKEEEEVEEVKEEEKAEEQEMTKEEESEGKEEEKGEETQKEETTAEETKDEDEAKAEEPKEETPAVEEEEKTGNEPAKIEGDKQEEES